MNSLGWLWLSFLGLWKVAGIGKEHPSTDEIQLSLLLYIGLALLIFGNDKPPPKWALYTVIGCFILAAFARYELGDNFYNRTETKETGPYALLEHPIYIAIGLAVILTAIAYGTIQGYLGAVAASGALYAKALEEENGR